jgi:hypothetical protein
MNLLSAEARFSIPALVPLSVLAAVPLSWSGGGISRASKFVLVAVFALNAIYTFEGDRRSFWPSLKGGENQSEYLSHRHPTYGCPPYPTFHWANKNLPESSKVLFIGEGRPFYLERDRENGSAYDFEEIVQYANSAASETDLYLMLKRRGISHIFINGAEIIRQRQEFRFTPGGLRNLQLFWKTYVRFLYMDRNEDPNDARVSLLYEILSSQEAAKPHAAPVFPLST